MVVGIGVDSEAYRRQEPGVERGNSAFVMGRSELMLFAQCPRRWLNGYNSKDSESTDWGSLLDCLVLDPARLTEKYVVAPATYLADGRKKGDPQVEKPWNRNATTCREWEEAHKDKIVIKAAEHGESEAALKFLRADPQIDYVLETSAKQVMVVAEYRDRETKLVVPVKILIDLVPALDSDYAKALFDFKTSLSADPARWPRLVFDRGYHVQAAMYLDVYTAATGEDRLEFLHIVQENFAPFESSKMGISEEFLAMGRDAYRAALRKYCWCLANNHWPGYAPAHLCINGWNYVQPEAWMVAKG
jgi:hypothetical protein